MIWKNRISSGLGLIGVNKIILPTSQRKLCVCSAAVEPAYRDGLIVLRWITGALAREMWVGKKDEKAGIEILKTIQGLGINDPRSCWDV